MKASYIDSSVLLRVILLQNEALKEFFLVENPISSELIRPECLRAIDRERILGSSLELYDKRVKILEAFLSKMELIKVNSLILQRVGNPQLEVIGTLDAIHLHSILLWREKYQTSPCLLTHDKQLARVASAYQINVVS